MVDSFKLVDPERYEEMITTYRKHNHEHHDLLVQQYEGVYETIEALHQQGYKMAVVTSKIHDTADKGLETDRA